MLSKLHIKRILSSLLVLAATNCVSLQYSIGKSVRLSNISCTQAFWGISFNTSVDYGSKREIGGNIELLLSYHAVHEAPENFMSINDLVIESMVLDPSSRKVGSVLALPGNVYIRLYRNMVGFSVYKNFFKQDLYNQRKSFYYGCALSLENIILNLVSADFGDLKSFVTVSTPSEEPGVLELVVFSSYKRMDILPGAIAAMHMYYETVRLSLCAGIYISFWNIFTYIKEDKYRAAFLQNNIASTLVTYKVSEGAFQYIIESSKFMQCRLNLKLAFQAWFAYDVFFFIKVYAYAPLFRSALFVPKNTQQIVLHLSVSNSIKLDKVIKDIFPFVLEVSLGGGIETSD